MVGAMTMAGAFPVAMADPGKLLTVARIEGRDKVQSFLADLGFVPGAKITIISEVAGNMIFKVKDTRVALGKDMATKILVY